MSWLTILNNLMHPFQIKVLISFKKHFHGIFCVPVNWKCCVCVVDGVKMRWSWLTGGRSWARRSSMVTLQGWIMPWAHGVWLSAYDCHLMHSWCFFIWCICTISLYAFYNRWLFKIPCWEYNSTKLVRFYSAYIIFTIYFFIIIKLLFQFISKVYKKLFQWTYRIF